MPTITGTAGNDNLTGSTDADIPHRIKYRHFSRA